MAQKKITKVDLVEAVFLDTSLEKKEIQEVVDSLLEKIKDSLKGGSSIELRGNPKTGELVSVEPHSVAVFRPGKELKDTVWKIKSSK